VLVKNGYQSPVFDLTKVFPFNHSPKFIHNHFHRPQCYTCRMQLCHVHCLGFIPYQQARDMQTDLAVKIASGEIPPTLLLLEHPHTFTFGRQGKASHLLWSESELEQRGIQVFWVDRGGDVTYHGPGQLVGYPLIPLQSDDLIHPDISAPSSIPTVDYTGYLRHLEEVLILALQGLGVTASRIKNLTGVWVDGSKIASIGVKVDAHGITRHGFSLNVAPDMSFWAGIVACGLEGYPVTSLARLLPEPPSMQQVIQAVIPAFEDVFEVRCLIIS
jgi:lipoyl(octanoyl) transferase